MNPSLAILIALSSCLLASCLDSVSEGLTLRPLTNGDWFLELDTSIVSKDVQELLENPEDPYFLMDAMPIDIAKLYLKTKSDWFEANLGFGEWKDSVWGDRPETLVTHGLSLLGSWPYLDKKAALEQYSTLCYGLWGVTGSMFPNLVSEETFIHDLTHLYSNDYETIATPSSTVLFGSDFEDRACLDVLYKLRLMLPCICTNGLVSLLGDERMFVRSSYRGVKLRAERVGNDLVFRARVQFTVSKSMLPASFGGFFPLGNLPRTCFTVSESSVKLVFPESSKSQNYNAVNFNYLDYASRTALSDKYMELVAKFPRGYELQRSSTELVFEVSELDSRYLRVLKRVQSSLLIRVANLSGEPKRLCVNQPLPYWLNPLLHSVSLVVERTAGSSLHYKCAGANCFARNSRDSRNFNLFLDIARKLLPPAAHARLMRVSDLLDPVPKLPHSPADPLMIFERGKLWNRFGLYLSLPAESVLYLSVELSKDNITYQDIHLAAHRGQLIPSGLLLDLERLGSASFSSLSSLGSPPFLHVMTSFFSHIVLPDNTMVFNVMAVVGLVTALMFGLVFNTLTKDWNRAMRLR